MGAIVQPIAVRPTVLQTYPMFGAGRTKMHVLLWGPTQGWVARSPGEVAVNSSPGRHRQGAALDIATVILCRRRHANKGIGTRKE